MHFGATALERRAVHLMLEESWPVDSAVDDRALLAEIKKGESIPVDDAFAEIAGVSKTQWLRKVQEHEEQKKQK